MPDQKGAPSSGAVLLARLYWMFIGTVLLLFLLVFIFEKRPRFPSLHDAAYWVAVASLVIVRYVDIRFLSGKTGEGQPATLADWRRYTVLLGSVGMAAWLLVRAIVHLLK